MLVSLIADVLYTRYLYPCWILQMAPLYT